jgi:hypothetical protein
VLWVDDHHATTRSLEHVAIAQDRKARIEGDVAVAAKEDAQNSRERVDASTPEDSGELRRAAARILFQQQPRDRDCASLQLAVRESCSGDLECRPFRKQGG